MPEDNYGKNKITLRWFNLGSPWVVDVQNADHVVVSGKGLHLVPVGVVTCFEVKTGSSDVDVTVNITCKFLQLSEHRR